MSLENLVLDAQAGSQSAMLELLTRFRPLLMSYVYKLQDVEDAFEVMRLNLLETIMAVDISNLSTRSDEQIAAYFKTSMQNAFLNIRRKQVRSPTTYLFSDLSLAQQNYFNTRWSVVDSGFVLLKLDAHRILTPWEYEVLILIFSYDLTVQEIAKLNNVTRQAVNQTKNYALMKLRIEFQLPGKQIRKRNTRPKQ